MSADLFADFFRAVHGHAPFPWQVRLARQVTEVGWPAVLALPTAAGKTSTLDIAVFALALQTGLPLARRAAPLRTFFVIDRRLVVDQAAEHARRLQRALEDPDGLAAASPEGVAAVRGVTNALRRFGGPVPLYVTALRGGLYRDDVWAKAPHQPTVCVSTVDQVGSRLLFRGYGVSEFARPVHAALTGNDALYLVDEAHLSQPFLETLRAVAGYRAGAWADVPLGGPFGVVEISATPQSAAPPFRLDDEDHDNPELRRRLVAPKPAELVEPARFEDEAARLAVQACDGDVRVVGIVVNRVASAREIYRRLPGKPLQDKVLLTGRVRPWDRDALLRDLLPRVRAGRVRSPADRPLFVAATMTVEVGADLDFDHLITEAAPLPALRQRFGRLDRLGRFGQSSGTILLRKARGPDAVYGDDLAASWNWLREQAGGGVIDFGIVALDRLVQGAATPPPSPQPRPAPVLFPAHLDAWVQTSPAPWPDPDVAPFLHGADALDAADVQVVWRADLLEDGMSDEDWLAVVAVAPPLSRETLVLPIAAVRGWLRGAPAVEVADVEGVGSRERDKGPGRRALRWYGPDESAVISPDEIRPGDTLVVPATYGGVDAFGWDPESTAPAADIGDLCVNDMADRAPDDGRKRLIRLRLHPTFLAALPTPPGEDNGVVHQVRLLHNVLEDGEDYAPVLAELLEALSCPLADRLMTSVVEQFSRGGTRITAYPAGVVLTARVSAGFSDPSAPYGVEAPDDGTDVDDTASSRAGTYPPAAVTLRQHTEGVVRWVTGFAESVGLAPDLVAVLARAADLHDLGKADRRFQFVLYGDEPGDELLAKSGRDLDARQRALVRNLSGLPAGFRHEFVSVALVREHRTLLADGLTEEQLRLVEWLVGTHHGRGRPFVPFIEEPADNGGPEAVTLEWSGRRLGVSPDHGLWHLEARWADEFWRLVRRYGFWGLAYLEALLRLADAARSAEEQGEVS